MCRKTKPAGMGTADRAERAWRGLRRLREEWERDSPLTYWLICS